MPCSDRERCLLLLLVCVAGCIVHKCPGEYATRRHAQGNDRTFCDATGPELNAVSSSFVRVELPLLSNRSPFFTLCLVFITVFDTIKIAISIRIATDRQGARLKKKRGKAIDEIIGAEMASVTNAPRFKL